MKKPLIFLAAMLALLVGGVSIAAGFGGESVSINYKTKPMKGKFNPKKFLPAQINWGVSVKPAVGAATILPMTVADLKFPNNKTMRFVPKKGLKVCTATAESGDFEAPPSEIYAGPCGKSVIGNGEATFALSKQTVPANQLAGTVVVLYGGKVGNNVKIKFSAWSNDTGAGVYAEGILKPDGKMYITMPVLSYDSAVTSLQLSMPGKKVTGEWVTGGTYTLKAGMDPNFVRVKCKTGKKLPFSAGITLQQRNEDTLAPYGPVENLKPSSSTKCGK